MRFGYERVRCRKGQAILKLERPVCVRQRQVTLDVRACVFLLRRSGAAAPVAESKEGVTRVGQGLHYPMVATALSLPEASLHSDGKLLSRSWRITVAGSQFLGSPDVNTI